MRFILKSCSKYMGSYTRFMDERGQEERDIVCIDRLFAGYKRI